MSDSLVFAQSRSGEIHVIDPDVVAHTDDLHPIMRIAAAVMNAGYEGIDFYELKLRDGRILQSLDVNTATPEGRLFNELSAIMRSGGYLPNAQTVIDRIDLDYRNSAKSERAA